MRAHHLAGFLALFFWQSAPFHVSTSHARFRVSFAAATGQWEDYYESVGCNGEVLESRASAVPTQSLGARGDVLLGDGSIRLTAVGGRASADSAGMGQGTFWGLGAAWEGRNIGLGVGYRRAGDALKAAGNSEDWTSFAGYLRFGRLDRVHVRGEMGPLSETPSLAGEGRAGVAFGEGTSRQVSVFIGAVVGPSVGTDETPVGAFGDFGFPILPGVDLLLRGVYAPGHKLQGWGAGAGFRTRF